VKINVKKQVLSTLQQIHQVKEKAQNRMGVKRKANSPLFESQQCFWHHSCDTKKRFIAFSLSLDFLFVQIVVFSKE